MHKRIVVYGPLMPMPSAHTFHRLARFYGVDTVRGNGSAGFALHESDDKIGA